MAEAVYLLCLLTSALCAGLLFRSWRSSRTRLLLWSSACFTGLAINNLFLFVDLVVLPSSIDLSLFRGVIALLSVLVLVHGLIWDVRS
jgi:uncharacterized paraquat-inducible protein A